MRYEIIITKIAGVISFEETIEQTKIRMIYRFTNDRSYESIHTNFDVIL